MTQRPLDSVVELKASLPRAEDAEKALLGGILVQNDLLLKVLGRLKATHFSQAWCGAIYAAMVTLAQQQQAIDYITLRTALGPAGVEQVGGISRISTLDEGVPQGMNVEHYADIVINTARLRLAVIAATQTIDEAVRAEDDADTVIRRAMDAFFQLGAVRRTDTLWSASQMTTSLFKRMEALEQTGYGLTGIATGIHELDLMTNGLQPGELVIIGARPSVGKTALALQLALFMARMHPGLFCSLEMGQGSVWDRALFNLARVNGFLFKRGRLRGDQTTFSRISLAIQYLDPLHLWLDEQPAMSAIDILARAQQLQLAHGLKFVVVDYLQLMRVADLQAVRGQNTSKIVGDMTLTLKNLARSLNVVVILLSQLNRAADEKARPSMNNLRESGDIEAHADIVILLHRKETKEELHELPVGEPSHVEMLIEKQRGNPTGIIQLLNYREQYRYASATRGDTDLLEAIS